MLTEHIEPFGSWVLVGVRVTSCSFRIREITFIHSFQLKEQNRIDPKPALNPMPQH